LDGNSATFIHALKFIDRLQALRIDNTNDIVICNNTIHKGKTLGATIKDLKVNEWYSNDKY